MSKHNGQRDLLLGVLAVQMDFVTADELVAGMHAWSLDKSTPLGEHLARRGSLKQETHELLNALVEKHVEQHGGEVDRSLASISPDDTLRGKLAQVQDVDLQATIARFETTDADSAHATMPFEPRSTGDHDRFQVLRPHAQGGLGKVSVAHDAQLNREVALKELLDSHADNLASRVRFLQEAEITGGLEHPGIVPIYGLGQYADGRPFYAMRFIRGDSLQEAIDRFHKEASPKWEHPADVLQLRRLLGRMIDVCNAVGYAHSRGVLHRDLKPGNVMLGRYGETLVVDWGLAKPLGKADGPSPAAAADIKIPVQPEQPIRPSGSGSAPTQMGSAVGTPAFMSPEQAAGRLDALGPASDIYSLGATLYYLLTGRPPQTETDLGVLLQRIERGEFVSPRQVKAAVPKPLEAICVKAMALSQADRYDSPAAMAGDIENWLADEPVAAYPEPWTSRTRRWVKKHSTLVASSVAMFLVAAISLGVGVVLLSAANERERTAKENAVAARGRAEEAETKARRQSERNEELLALARRSIEQYEKLSKDELLQRYGMESLRTELLSTAVDYYTTLAGQVGSTLQDRTDRAFAQYRLGMTLWGLGDIPQAEEALRKSLAERTALYAENPDNVDYAADAAATAADLGELLSRSQRGEEAEALLTEAIEQLANLGESHPDRPWFRVQRAISLTFEAERIRRFGNLEQAAELVTQAIEGYREVLAEFNDDLVSHQDVRLRTAQALLQLSALEQALWSFQSASEHCDQAVALLQQLRVETPQAVSPRESLVRALSMQGQLLARQNQVADAIDKYELASERVTELDRAYPDVLRFRRMKADLLHSLALTHNPMNNQWMTEERLQQLQQAVAITEDLAKKHSGETDLTLSLARYQGTLGLGYSMMGRADEAQVQFDAAQQKLLEHSELGAGNLESRFALAQQQSSLAQQLATTDDPDGAIALYDAAEEQLKLVLEMGPRLPEAHLSLSNIYLYRADIYLSHYHLREGIAELDKLIAKSERMSDVGDAAWLNMGFNVMVNGAKAQRWVAFNTYRSDYFNNMIDEGRYLLAADQLASFAELTGNISDNYEAGRWLSVVAAKLATTSLEELYAGEEFDPNEAAAERDEAVGQIAANAVEQLAAAWDGGYIRRKGGLTSIFSSRPTLNTLREADDFAPIRNRKDFQQLLDRIENSASAENADDADPSQNPPPEEGSSNAQSEQAD